MNDEEWKKKEDKHRKKSIEEEYAIIEKYFLKYSKKLHKGYCGCEKCKEINKVVMAFVYRLDFFKDILNEISLRNGGVGFNSRGYGKEWVSCFICEEGTLNDNVSGFVKSKSDGEKIVKMFPKHIFLDYREHEPNYIQVKIGACKKHLKKLKKFINHTYRSGTIEQWMVDEAYWGEF